MATTLITVDCKLFQMMPFIIILKVRKFHQPIPNRFSTAREKPVEGGGAEYSMCLNRVKKFVPNVPAVAIIVIRARVSSLYVVK